MKLCSVVCNPKNKIQLLQVKIGPLLPLFFTFLMHFQWQCLNITLATSVDKLWRLMAKRMLLGGSFTAVLKNVITPCFSELMLFRIIV